MFGLFKKKVVGLGADAVLPVSTDIHSHILPGIDDGSPDLVTSLTLIKGLHKLGIRRTVATPHIIGDLYRNTAETIMPALDMLKTACADEGIDIEISAAAEYMLDDYFIKLLRSDVPLLCVHKKFLLIEQSYAAATSNLNEISFELISQGYQPIMAHPERYFFYHNKYEAYTHLKDMGFLLQVNLLSLTGYYGKSVARAAKYIFDNNLADFVATDLHHLRHLAALQDGRNLALFHKYLSAKKYNVLEEL
ncbi:MAG TPA: histidinol phosphatase [Ferruginibacter sp.]|nr:histidinol phosphatase [Ferruginibacter sp.]HMP20164.1 histidinol phosphatase [Ferruginibacter sp.]